MRRMPKPKCLAALLLTLATSLIPFHGMGQQIPATAAPSPGRVVSLHTWTRSSEEERYAFLIGFLSLLEVEQRWQLQAGADPGSSMVDAWSRAFEGRTLRQIHDTINEYIAAYPNDINRPVVEVMWFTFARPLVQDQLRNPEPEDRVTEAVRQHKR